MTKVIKLAQRGFDVKTAGDENLIYNSNWPTLKIYKQGSYTINDLTQLQTITTHDLGFVPFFWWYSNENIEGWEGSGVQRTTQTRAEFHGDMANGLVKMTDSKLFFDPIVGGPTGSTTIYYYIFALPITVNYTAPIIRVGGQTSLNARSGRVFKIAKPTKNINSHRLEDYVIHSDARSPMVHAVKNGRLAGSGLNTFTVEHNLGYKPMFFGFYLQPDGSYILLYGSSIIAGLIGFNVDEKMVQYIYPSTDIISIVVLKDPFVVDYSVQVNI